MNKKRYIAQQSGTNTIKIFDAETGQLFKIFSVPGRITSPPICTESEMYVGVEQSGGQYLMYYGAPTFNLIRHHSV